MLPSSENIFISKINEEIISPIKPAKNEVVKYQKIILAASFPPLPLEANLFIAGDKARKIKIGTILMNTVNTEWTPSEIIFRWFPNEAPIINPITKLIKDHRYVGIFPKFFFIYLNII